MAQRCEFFTYGEAGINPNIFDMYGRIGNTALDDTPHYMQPLPDGVIRPAVIIGTGTADSPSAGPRFPGNAEQPLPEFASNNTNQGNTGKSSRTKPIKWRCRSHSPTVNVGTNPDGSIHKVCPNCGRS